MQSPGQQKSHKRLSTPMAHPKSKKAIDAGEFVYGFKPELFSYL
jgi:hypothetical protein